MVSSRVRAIANSFCKVFRLPCSLTKATSHCKWSCWPPWRSPLSSLYSLNWPADHGEPATWIPLISPLISDFLQTRLFTTSIIEEPGLMRKLTIGKILYISMSIGDILFMLKNARTVEVVVDWLLWPIVLLDEVSGCFFDFELEIKLTALLWVFRPRSACHFDISGPDKPCSPSV